MKDHNYKYIVTKNMVIAISTYAGRTVRGVAKCHPNDTFDEEFGKRLAAARCNEKIAIKRFARAGKVFIQSVKALNAAESHYFKMRTYRDDAYYAWKKAQEDLDDLQRV